MSAIKLLLGLTDPCGHCAGQGEVITPTTYYGAEGLEQDWHYEPCQACNGTGEAVDAPAILEQVAEEHQLITEQKERTQWMH